MSTFRTGLLAVTLVLTATSALAAQGAKEKSLPPPLPVQKVSLDPLPTVADQEKVGGLKIIITQVNYPGVPERASCRFVVRAVNESRDRVATYALLHTFGGAKENLNTWMVPTGELKPGEASERLYSCKTAAYLKVDRASMTGWPGRCEINGQERIPCPLSVGLEANLNVIAKE